MRHSIARRAALGALAMLAAQSALADAPVTGTLVAAGNRATNPLMEAWILGFKAKQPAITVTLRSDTRVSTDAFDLAIASTDIDIVPAARELVPSEVERLTARLGGPPLVLAVATGSHSTKSATHALAFYVNAANPLTRISLDQVRQIYGPSGTITKWGQLGLTGEWAEKPINVFTVPISDPNGNPLGITNYLRERLFAGKSGLRRSVHQIDTTGAGIERHMLTNIVRHIGEDRYAIGFSGFAFATPAVRKLALAETDAGPWYEGTLEDVRTRRYPLTRTIYLAVNQRAGTPLRPALREFLRHVLSPEGQAIFAGGVDAYLPLPAGMAERERAKIQ